jgi:large subunit ribosomal protein L10
MNRTDKEQFVAEIRSRFEASPLVILSDWKGSTVDEMNELRRACEPAGIHFQVVKNTLCKRAVEGTEHEGLTQYFKGNIGVFFSGEDPIAAAKLYKESRKDNDKLICRAGFFEGSVIDEAGVDVVATLPSREELLVTLLRTLQAGPRQVLGVLQGPARDLLYLLNNYATKLEEEA